MATNIATTFSTLSLPLPDVSGQNEIPLPDVDRTDLPVPDAPALKG